MIYSFTGGVGIYFYTSLYRVRSHKGAPGFQINIIELNRYIMLGPENDKQKVLFN
jgi:hypothetical protein